MEGLALIFIGESLLNSPIFCEEVTSHIQRIATTPEIKAHYPCPLPKMYRLIEFLAEDSREIVLICSPEFYPQLKEHFASLTLASPLWESDTKTPVLYLQFTHARLHMCALDIGDLIPSFSLLEYAKPLNLCLMGIDEESAQLLLSPLAREYGYSLHAFTPFLGASMLKAREVTPALSGNLPEIPIANKEDDQSCGYSLKIGESVCNSGKREQFLEEVALLFGGKIFPLENLAQKVVKELKKRREIVVTAESCTGGGVAQLLTQIPGASEVFYGGVISYDNSIKERWLGVKHETLKLYGAVSEPTIKEMLHGALYASLRAHYAIAISGIAGPSGGSTNKPVGTVFFGVCKRGEHPLVERIHFTGNRKSIQQQASHYALYLLLRTLME